MIRFSLAIAGILAIGSQLTHAQDTVAVDLVVNNQIRKVVVQLNPEAAPQTCENFKRLARSGFYKGLAVHRASPDYIVQMGDPFTRNASQKELWGTGGPDYTVPAEIKLPHIRGAIAMARLPDSRNPSRESNGSQFYFALDDLDHLNSQYTVFGRVINGIEHLDYIAEQTVDTNDVPINRIEISAVSVAGETTPTKVLAPVAAAASGVVGSVGGDGSGGAVREAPGKMLSAAGEGMRGAGGAVAGVIPDRIAMPKMPSFGRKDGGSVESEEPPAPEEVFELAVEETPADEEQVVDEKKRRLPTISR
ncbi:MAG: peptidylprolyl isomerase, partial [Verrucomicrobiota bacterium]